MLMGLIVSPLWTYFCLSYYMHLHHKKNNFCVLVHDTSTSTFLVKTCLISMMSQRSYFLHWLSFSQNKIYVAQLSSFVLFPVHPKSWSHEVPTCVFPSLIPTFFEIHKATPVWLIKWDSESGEQESSISVNLCLSQCWRAKKIEQ